MVRKIKGSVVHCDECGSYLEYSQEDLEYDYNALHTKMCVYVHCPVCGNDIFIREVEHEYRP